MVWGGEPSANLADLLADLDRRSRRSYNEIVRRIDVLKGIAMSARNANRLTSNHAHGFLRGGTIINIITALIFFGLLGAGVLWVVKTGGDAGKQYATAMIDTKHNTTTLSCQMNFRSISQCLQAYAIGGEGFPADQQEFVSACGGRSKLLRCPDPCGVEYIYIPGARPDMPETTVLVYEAKPVHEGRCNVLFLGGQIEALTPDALQPFLDATQSRRRR